MKDIEKRNRYLSVAKLAAEYTAFTQCTLRHLNFNASENNFYTVIKRIGKRKLLLSEEAFHEWIENQNNFEGGNQ